MIIFNDAEALSVSHQFEYLGDNLNYRKVNTFSVRGRFISNSSNESSSYFGVAYVEDSGIWYPVGGSSPLASGGVPSSLSGYLTFSGSSAIITMNDPDLVDAFGGELSPLYDIWSEMDAIRDRFQDFQQIVLNGVSLGSGRVTSFSFPENRDPRKCEFNVEFETYHTGNLYNWTGAGYGNTSINTDIAPFISSLSESFEFELLKDSTVNYSRNLDFELISTGTDYATDVSRAKTFASGLFYGDPAFSVLTAQYPSFYQASGNRVFSETYNAIQGSYNFSETFKGPTSGESYYWTNGFSLKIDSDGETTINENGTVMGVRLPAYTYALEGINEIESTSKARAEDFFYSYATGCADELFLKNSSKTIDAQAGSIDYNFDYVSDPFSVGCFTVSRTLESNYDDNGLVTITEQGSVSDRCGASGEARLNNSIEYFNDNISGGVLSRVFDYYDTRFSGCGCSGSGTSAETDLRQLSRSHTYSEFNGIFDYSYVYRNDCTSIENECYLVTLEKELRDTIHNVFLDITVNSGEIAQGQNTSNLIRETQRISVLGQCTGLDMEGYLSIAASKIVPPTGSTFYMDSADYIFNPDDSRFELSVYYNYTGYRTYSNINV